jgi:catechol 2,3-dioxygenase
MNRKEFVMTTATMPAETRIGHVHLKVADLERAIRFYRDLIGFDLLMNFGTAAFLSAGGYHHHLGLNTW